MWWVVFNQKGGVGKLMIVCNLVVISVSEGLCMFVIDFDVQVNLMCYLFGDVVVDV